MGTEGGIPALEIHDDLDLPLATAARRVFGRSQVVVIDDEPANVALLERLLRSAGVAGVHGFTDPREAIAFCADVIPDLVLLDFHMPALDGIAVMDALQALVPSGFLPILVLTADVSVDAKQRALSAGAKDFLTKPFDRVEVLLRVRNLLETRALYVQLEHHNAELQRALDEQVEREREVAVERQRRLHRIDEVLAGSGITMVFQPIVDLATTEVVGAEALARFSGEPRRPPNEWFAEAAEVGRGVDLELSAVASALAQLDEIPDDLFLSINSSPEACTSPALERIVRGSSGERIVIELTEHTRVDDYAPLLDALARHRARGVRVAVDDTGAGYAGFQHLLLLEPEILKLDMTLTRGIDADPGRRALAIALVAFGHDIGAVIIAEGVETPGELSALRDLGIAWGQGYHIAIPAPLPLASRPG